MALSSKGLVTRIYPDTNGCYIRTTGTPSPQHSYYQLLLTHPNYNALYSLALSAAVNKIPLEIRTAQDIDANSIAEVVYLTADF